MRLSDFRVGWRVLWQQPGWSAVGILGLAVGFAACLLLLGFVRYSLGYNGQVPDAERVYLIKQRIHWLPRPEWRTSSLLPLRDVALASGAVEAASMARGGPRNARVENAWHELETLVVDPAFAQIFGLQTLEGDLAAVLAHPDSLALTRDTALRLFGKTPALGRSIQINGEVLRVGAILADLPANSSRSLQALAGPASRLLPVAERGGALPWKMGEVYLKLKPGAPAAPLQELLQAAAAASPSEQALRKGLLGGTAKGPGFEVALLAMPELYFDSDLAASRNGARYGKRGALYGLAAIALLILGLAAGNYVNLGTVRALRRQREIGLRKLLGATPWRVAGQFITESTLSAMLALVLGLVLAWLLLPLFADLVQRRLDGFFSPPSLACALLGALLTGALAGLYPAWVALRAHPASALSGRGNGETMGGIWLRRALSAGQFAAAMALCSVTLAVAWQVRFAGNAEVGFDPAGLSVLDLPRGMPAATQQALAEALARLPGVEGASLASEAVGRDGLKISSGFRLRDGTELKLEKKPVSPGHFANYRLQARAGRLFQGDLDRTGDAKYVLNAAAVKVLGYERPEAAIGQSPFASGGTVIGIAPELRYQNLRQQSEPLVYVLDPDFSVLTLRSGHSAQELNKLVLPVWQRYAPDAPLRMAPAASFFAENYAEDGRLATILAVFGAVALLLAACGIYVLAAYSVQRQQRQIVLRKLHGAGRRAIAALLGREFAWLLACGALLGLPPAASAIERYLAGFVERAPMGGWPLLAAVLLTALAALLATARHLRAALRLPPALALRDA